MEKIYKELSRVQKDIKVPKNRPNDYGGFNYRSAEDILKKVKDVLKDSAIILTDDLISAEGRFYVKATATLVSEGESVSSVAFAREPDSKKGMDASQITGAASSYARKYALCGLLAIDDGIDADSMDNSEKEAESVDDLRF